MKKLIMALFVAAMVAPVSVALADTLSTPNVPVSASVDEQLVLDMAIVKENPDGSLDTTPQTEIAWTALRNGNNAVGGDVAYHVFLGTNTSGRDYNVTWTMGALKNAGGVELPDSVGMFPVQVTDGNGGAVPGGTLATKQSLVGTDKQLYANTDGNGAVIETVLGWSGGNADGSEPFPGWEPTPPGQAAGTYTAAPALKFTITTV